jgi:hypothetical protein
MDFCEKGTEMKLTNKSAVKSLILVATVAVFSSQAVAQGEAKVLCAAKDQYPYSYRSKVLGATIVVENSKNCAVAVNINGVAAVPTNYETCAEVVVARCYAGCFKSGRPTPNTSYTSAIQKCGSTYKR